MKTFIKWALIAVIGCFIILLGFSIYLLIKEPSGANICATVSILLGFLLSLVLEVQQRLINRYHNELLNYLGEETDSLRRNVNSLMEQGQLMCYKLSFRPLRILLCILPVCILIGILLIKLLMN